MMLTREAFCLIILDFPVSTGIINKFRLFYKLTAVCQQTCRLRQHPKTNQRIHCKQTHKRLNRNKAVSIIQNIPKKSKSCTTASWGFIYPLEGQFNILTLSTLTFSSSPHRITLAIGKVRCPESLTETEPSCISDRSNKSQLKSHLGGSSQLTWGSTFQKP